MKIRKDGEKKGGRGGVGGEKRRNVKDEVVQDMSNNKVKDEVPSEGRALEEGRDEEERDEGRWKKKQKVRREREQG